MARRAKTKPVAAAEYGARTKEHERGSPRGPAITIHRSAFALIANGLGIDIEKCSLEDIDHVKSNIKGNLYAEVIITDDDTHETARAAEEVILSAVHKLREDYRRTKFREAMPTTGKRRPDLPRRKPGPRAKDSTDPEIVPSEYLKAHYGDLIEAGTYFASDLKRDAPSLYNALNKEALEAGKSLGDYLPLKNQRYEEMRHHLATILGTSVDEAARYFGSARRSMESARGGGRGR